MATNHSTTACVKKTTHVLQRNRYIAHPMDPGRPVSLPSFRNQAIKIDIPTYIVLKG